MSVSVYEALKTAGVASGAIVVSTAGHDKGRVYLVLEVKEKMAFLADGRTRSSSGPKKKRVTHVKVLGITDKSAERAKEMTEAGNNETADMIIREVISEFFDKTEEMIK